MDKKLPGGRFRVFLAVLGLCLATGIVLSYFDQGAAAGSHGATGTLEKMIVADGTATVDLDMSRLTGKGGRQSLPFALAPDSFFTIQVLNNELRGPMPGNVDLTPQRNASLPARLNASFRQLTIESVPRGGDYELVIRDSKSGFVFFGVEGHQFDYDAASRVLNIRDGRVVISNDFAAALGRPADARTVVGELTVTANMRPVEVTQIVDGEVQSESLPPMGRPETGSNPGPDVIVGELSGLAQFGNSAGTQVGLAVGTESCNFGQVDLHWYQLPDNDHPVIPQNLYRMSGGPTNDDTFEQVGQSQMKHAFTALTNNVCGLGCNGHGGSVLGSGCSDPYGASLNAGPSLGSRAWANPFTGFYPRGDSQTPPNNHNGHNHLGPSHRILVEINDLNTSLNPGASYYAEAQYVTKHEYDWCSANPGSCSAASVSNTANDVSYHKYTVSGTSSPFTFGSSGGTVRMKPAIEAWTGSTRVLIEPDPGNDGIAYIAYKVTNPSPNVWHYEYAIYNQNLDRAIQSFRLPFGSGVSISNFSFHAPPQHPGWTFDGTMNNAGYSNAPWTEVQDSGSTMWTSASFAADPNANACRWGTLYNIRFDSDREPSAMYASVGFYKTGNPYYVQVQGPSSPQAPWPCTSRRRSGIPQVGCG
jgi:hypothetical protein